MHLFFQGRSIRFHISVWTYNDKRHSPLSKQIRRENLGNFKIYIFQIKFMQIMRNFTAFKLRLWLIFNNHSLPNQVCGESSIITKQFMIVEWPIRSPVLHTMYSNDFFRMFVSNGDYYYASLLTPYAWPWYLYRSWQLQKTVSPLANQGTFDPTRAVDDSSLCNNDKRAYPLSCLPKQKFGLVCRWSPQKQEFSPPTHPLVTVWQGQTSTETDWFSTTAKSRSGAPHLFTCVTLSLPHKRIQSFLTHSPIQ